jgi:hypothetical protein
MYAPAVFVDESRARGYLLVAVFANSADLPWTRKHVKTLRLPRQRRLHFTTESKPHRKLCGLANTRDQTGPRSGKQCDQGSP